MNKYEEIKFLKELEKKIPFSLEDYSFFIKHSKVMVLLVNVKYLPRPLLIKKVSEIYGTNINTVKKTIEEFISRDFLGSVKLKDYSIVYTKSKLLACYNYVYETNYKRVDVTRINNVGLIRNILLMHVLMEKSFHIPTLNKIKHNFYSIQSKNGENVLIYLLDNNNIKTVLFSNDEKLLLNFCNKLYVCSSKENISIGIRNKFSQLYIEKQKEFDIKYYTIADSIQIYKK